MIEPLVPAPTAGCAARKRGRPRVKPPLPRSFDGIGQALLLAREHLGLSQMNVAAKAGIGFPTVSSIERGYREPSWFTLLAMSKALGCRIVIDAGQWRVEGADGNHA